MIQKWIKPHLWQLFQQSSFLYQRPILHKAVYLDENENPYAVFGKRYPQNRFAILDFPPIYERLSVLWNVPSKNLRIVADEYGLLQAIASAVLNEHRKALVITPCEPYVVQLLQAQGSTVLIWNLLKASLKDLEQQLLQKPFLIYLSNPHNPTGLVIKEGVWKLLMDYTDGVLFIDESFIEFAKELSSLGIRAIETPNWVVKRSFSYAWGLAGLALTACIAHQAWISFLRWYLSPTQVNRIALQYLYEALEEPYALHSAKEMIIQQREWLYEALRSLSVVKWVFPSQANFLFVQFWDKGIYEHLCRYRFFIKPFEEGYRVSVGNETENRYFVRVLRRIGS